MVDHRQPVSIHVGCVGPPGDQRQSGDGRAEAGRRRHDAPARTHDREREQQDRHALGPHGQRKPKAGRAVATAVHRAQEGRAHADDDQVDLSVGQVRMHDAKADCDQKHGEDHFACIVGSRWCHEFVAHGADRGDQRDGRCEAPEDRHQGNRQQCERRDADREAR